MFGTGYKAGPMSKYIMFIRFIKAQRLVLSQYPCTFSKFIYFNFDSPIKADKKLRNRSLNASAVYGMLCIV